MGLKTIAVFVLLIGVPAARAEQDASDAVSLAIAARDQGRAQEALSLWEKAAELTPADGFVLNQKSWALLALGRFRDAKKSFSKTLELSTENAGMAEADFGLGMAQVLDSDPKSAAQTFQTVCTQNPYLYPTAAVWMSRLALRMGESHVALLYLRQSMDQDPFRPDVADALAALYQKEDSPREAWQTYQMARDINPLDRVAEAGMKKAEKSLHVSAEQLAVGRVLPSPMLQKPFAPAASPKLRVGIFADMKGTLSEAQKLLIASAGDFNVSHGGKEAGSGHVNETWEISWDTESRIITVRDSSRKLLYAGRDVIRIEPNVPGGGILIRDVLLENPHDRDLGDREFRGALELTPATSGYFVINELGEEEYLYNRVAALAPANAAMDELKAQAIVSRTGLQELKRRFRQPSLGVDLCDSAHCQAYIGISQERSESTDAVVATAGQKLYVSSVPASVGQQEHCAGLTEEGVVDSSSATVPSRTSEALERFLHSDPPKEDFCNATPLTPSSWARWMRVLEPAKIEEAVSDRGELGRIHEVKVISRSASGRVTGLDLIGSKGEVILQGEDALAEILPRLGLRSTLFSLQPLYHGKDLAQLIVWGAGSGNGHGMCVAGAMGQAYAGRGYKEILMHYFPGAEIR